jgi:hypothetical protein
MATVQFSVDPISTGYSPENASTLTVSTCSWMALSKELKPSNDLPAREWIQDDALETIASRALGGDLARACPIALCTGADKYRLLCSRSLPI